MSKIQNKVLFLLDSSGSMGVIREAAVNTFNQVLDALQKGSAASDQATTMAFYTFGEAAQPVSRKFFDAPIDGIKRLTSKDYHPDGNTPMLDCVGQAINDALSFKSEGNTSYVLNVITDGEENASRRFDSTAIRELLDKVQATDRWTITFMVPPGKKKSLCSRFSVPPGNVQEWEATEEGAKFASQSLSRGYSDYFTLRSNGINSSKGFFTTNLEDLTKKEVTGTLTNIASKVVVLPVPREAQIQSFVEARGYDFHKGCAYYQLTKTEKVQASKQILLMEKGKKAVYGGHEARDLLGLPANQDLKVKPGNHAGWDIYVQSTSNNRKLVRGTNLLYFK